MQLTEKAVMEVDLHLGKQRINFAGDLRMNKENGRRLEVWLWWAGLRRVAAFLEACIVLVEIGLNAVQIGETQLVDDVPYLWWKTEERKRPCDAKLLESRDDLAISREADGHWPREGGL